jgi:hypothetical protein
MELIRSQTFPITRQHVIAALTLIPGQPEILSGSATLRESRVKFICGTNVRQSIRSWLLAADVIAGNGRRYTLTDFAACLLKNDAVLANSSSWWAIHLNLCFSERCEPYRSFVAEVGHSGTWVAAGALLPSVGKRIAGRAGQEFAEATIKSDLEGIFKMFTGHSPVTDLGLIETRDEDATRVFRLGNPVVTDQTLVYALALAKRSHFRNAATVNFRELIGIDFHHFLGLSVSTLQRRLRDLSRQRAWEDYLKFAEGMDLESIELRDKLRPRHAVLALLQGADDTWL